MKIKFTGSYNNHKTIDVLDLDCPLRSCYRPGENKGPYTPGRGYSYYYPEPKLVCFTRHLHGCPHPIPSIDLEKARCCDSPQFAKPKSKNRPPSKQLCRKCKTWVSGSALKLLRKEKA